MFDLIYDFFDGIKVKCEKHFWSRLLFIIGFIALYIGWPLFLELIGLLKVENVELISLFNFTIVALGINVTTIFILCVAYFVVWSFKKIFCWLFFG